MIAIGELVSSFFREVGAGTVEIYNEFSLQHEFGIHLRSAVGPTHKVQFERPVSFFGLNGAGFLKKEIDISVYTPDRRERIAVELKFPRAGQYPEQIFKACQDGAFLEQIVFAGFDAGIFVMAADDHLFFSGPEQGGVYAYFRAGASIQGAVIKPTGRKDEQVTIKGPYSLSWQRSGSAVRYFHITVARKGSA